MGRENSLKHALAQISSDKVKDRADGQDLLRQIFSVRKNCESLAERKDGGGWLHTFQTMFGAVMMERTASLKAGKSTSAASASSAASTRLQRWAELMRWMVNRSVRYITGKTFSAVLTHLTQAMVHRGTFLEPLALDYIKSIKILLSRPEHLAHLTDDMWAGLMTLCWNAALGLPLDTSTDGWGYEATSNQDMEIDELDSATAPGGKLSAQAIELMSLVPMLLSSDSAPLLPAVAKPADVDDVVHRAGVPILRHIVNFLERYKIETSAHRSVLMGLNLLLAELELNYITEMRRAGGKLVPSLVTLLRDTRSMDTREHILLALRTLLPYVSANTKSPSFSAEPLFVSKEVAESVGKLVEILSKECWSGLRGAALPMMSFQFAVDQSASAPSAKGKEKEVGPVVLQDDSPFSSRLMKAGPLFSGQDAYTWSALEVEADCLVLVGGSSVSESPHIVITFRKQLHSSIEQMQSNDKAIASFTPSSSKRRRIEDPLGEALQACRYSRTVASRLSSLQVIYFLIERHWRLLHRQLQTDICETMRDLLQTDSDAGIQQWCLLNVAAAIGVSTDLPVPETVVEPVWQMATRKISQEVVARSASLFLHLVLVLGILDAPRRLSTIHSILADVHLQGPPAVYDSTCTLLAHSLALAQGDAKLHSLGLEDNVAAWISQIWSSQSAISGDSAGTHPLNPYDILCLLSNVCGGKAGVQEGAASLIIPPSPLGQGMQHRHEASVVRCFVLDQSISSRRVNRETVLQRRDNVNQVNDRRVKIVSKSFGSALDAASALLTGNGKLSAVTPNRLRSILDFSSTVLLFGGMILEDGGAFDRDALQHASKVLLKAVEVTCMVTRTSSERLFLMQGLDVVFGACSEGKQQAGAALLSSGPHSGILGETDLRKRGRRGNPKQSIDTAGASALEDAKLGYLWRCGELLDIAPALNKLLKEQVASTLAACRDELPPAENGSHSALDETDDFGDFAILNGDDSQAEWLGCFAIEPDGFYLDACVRLIIALNGLHQSGAPAVRRRIKDRELLNMLLSEDDGNAFAIMARPIFEAVAALQLEFNEAAALSFFDAVGEYLRSYQHSKSSRMQMLALDYIQATLPLWNDDSETRKNSQSLLDWFVKLVAEGKTPASHIRERVLTLLEAAVEAGFAKQVDPMLETILGLIEDPDIRIRFRAATAIGRRFDRLGGTDPCKFYSAVVLNLRARSVSDANGVIEYLISRIVYFANVIIVSAGARRPAMFHLYDLAAEFPELAGHVQGALMGVSEALGITKLSDFYIAHAARIIASQQDHQDQDPMHLAPSLYGFSTRKAYATAVLSSAGHVIFNLNHGPLWKALCEATGRPMSAWLDECVPAAVAMALALAADVPCEGDAAMHVRLETTYTHIQSQIAASDSRHSLEILNEQLDAIVSNLFLLIDDSMTDEACIDALGGGAAGVAASLLPSGGVPEVQDTLTPRASLAAVLAALRWVFLRKQGSMDRPRIAYHTLQELTGRLTVNIVLNERQRFRRNMSLLVAYFADNFREVPELMAALCRTALAMYAQPDLSMSASPLVRWTIQSMLKTKALQDKLACTFVRAARISQEFSGTETGQQMLVWLEATLNGILQHDAIAKQIVDPAIAMWPRPLPAALNERVAELEMKRLVELAEDVANPYPGKFDLSSRLVDALSASTRSSDSSSVTERTFWALRNAMPIELRSSAASAFIDLFYVAPWHLQAPELPMLTAAMSEPWLKEAPATLDPRGSLLAMLMTCLDGDRLELRHMAYRTLVSLVSGNQSVRDGHGLSRSDKKELLLVGELPQLPMETGKSDLAVLINSDEWANLHHRDTSEWVAAFAPLIAMAAGKRDPFYSRLGPLLKVEGGLAEKMLPALMQGALAMDYENTVSRDIISRYLQQVLASSSTPTPSLRIIIAVILHLQAIQPPWLSSRLASDAWLEVDFLTLTRAALRCKAYASALRFLETARDVDSPAGKYAERNFDYHELLYDIYSHIGDPDGFYGIPLAEDVGESLVRRLHHERQWTDAFAVHAAALESSGDCHQMTSVGRSLQAIGYNRLALALLKDHQDLPISMDLAWRTQSWDVPEPQDPSVPETQVFRALRAVHRQRDQSAALNIVKENLTQATSLLGHASIENMEKVGSAWRQCLCLREVQHWYDTYQPLVNDGRWEDPKWQRILWTPAHLDFTDAHLIVAIRKSLLSAANSRVKEPAALGNMLSKRSRCLNSLTVACELSICALARKSLRAPEAINAITDARRAASELDDITQQEVAKEFAQVLWMKGEHALAIDQLQRIQSQLRAKRSNHQKEDLNKLASVLGTLGEWLWAAKQAKADAIERNYFAEAVDRISGAPSDEKARVFARYAHFADQQQQALSADAGDVGTLRAAAEAKRREIQDMERRSRAAQTQEREVHTAHSLSRHARRLRLELDDDLQRLKEVTVSRLQYLTTACRMYAKALATSDTEDDGALRLCALWLEHFADDEFNGKIQTDLMAVPTWKFGTLIQQLTARLHKDPGEARPFQVNLEAVLAKLCHDHPFHIVYSILTLAHPLRKASRRQSALGSPREQAALDLITRVKTGARAKIVAQMDMFASAAIQWAETGLDKDKKLRDGLIMPATMPLAQLQNLDIPIPTADLPYDKTLSYNAVVTLRAYDSRYSIAGGQSRPKVMKAIGSDGRVHRELFKSRDDLRQDAVMEQVFSVINQQLGKDEVASQRRLRFRTYNVLPLANSNGIIEFVPHTMAIGDWLVPAHLGYHPDDHKPVVFKDTMKSLQEGSIDKRGKKMEAKFIEMRKQFHPVFRHFFREQQKQPMAWFLMRLNYARSLAVTSIAGHLLGLGDRHCSNILIDRISGELVHIDLGIAFDQGRLLHIPERVPFRLTNDMIDGLGMSGTEGTFKRCSEHTLRVLRAASDVLMTVLECLKYDPLQDWVAAPARKQKAQGGPAEDPTTTMTSAPGSDLADRALRGVARKLSRDLSVEYTVNELMREAKDTYNLANIFVGWQPWL